MSELPYYWQNDTYYPQVAIARAVISGKVSSVTSIAELAPMIGYGRWWTWLALRHMADDDLVVLRWDHAGEIGRPPYEVDFRQKTTVLCNTYGLSRQKRII